MKRILTLCILLLMACASNEEQHAFDSISDYYKAEVNYTKGFSSEVGKKSDNYISLNIKGSPYLSTEKPDQIAVYAAVLLYVNLSEEDASKYTSIKINLFENDSQKEAIYQRTYPIETIRSIAAQSENFQKAEHLLLNGSSRELSNLLTETYASAEGKNQFASAVEMMKKERTGVKSVKLLGVELLINNVNKERYLSYNGQIEWGNETTSSMKVRTFEDPTKKDIIHLNIK